MSPPRPRGDALWMRALAGLRDVWRAPAPLARPAHRADGVLMLVGDDRIDRRVLLEGRTLARAGRRVCVIAGPSPGDEEDERAFPELEIVRIDPARRVAPEIARRVGRLGRLGAFAPAFHLHHARFLEAALARPAAVVMAHDLPLWPAGVAAADAMGAALVFDAHELYPEQRRYPAWRRAVFRAAERALLPLAQAVVTVNPSVAAELTRRGAARPPTVLLNAPEGPLPEPPGPAPTLRERLGAPPERPIFLFHGALSVDRNLETLVAGFGLLAPGEASLAIVGPDGGLAAALEQAAGVNVRLLPPVPQRDVLALVAQADVGVIPYPDVDLNTRFATPNKTFDYIAAGLPVLANDLVEMRRLIAAPGLGLARAMPDAAAVAAAVREMIAADRAEMSARARQMAPAALWTAQEPALLALFDGLPIAPPPASC